MSYKSWAKVKLRVLEEAAMAGGGTSSHIQKSNGMKAQKAPEPDG